jgi:hypothetical protein
MYIPTKNKIDICRWIKIKIGVNVQLYNIFYRRKLLKGIPPYIYVKNSNHNKTN